MYFATPVEHNSRTKKEYRPKGSGVIKKSLEYLSIQYMMFSYFTQYFLEVLAD